MALVDRIFALTIMGLILLFSIIHLGVSIGLIVADRKYGDVFRPQIGLSAFNLVIFVFSLVTGVCGIVALALGSERFGRIVCVISGVVGIFSLASLIAAIVISDKSPSYVHSRFLYGMNRYKFESSARERIDRLQNKYKCCGADMWIDWANADLNRTVNINTTITSTVTTSTTTRASNSIEIIASPSASSLRFASENRKRNLDDILSNDVQHDPIKSMEHSRNKRQTVLSYGDILGLPISFGVVLPRSCCTADAVLTSNGSDAYCISNYNSVVNHFRTIGCARLVERDAGNQAMAFIIINSFLAVLAFVAIPAMIGKPADFV